MNGRDVIQNAIDITTIDDPREMVKVMGITVEGPPYHINNFILNGGVVDGKHDWAAVIQAQKMVKDARGWENMFPPESRLLRHEEIRELLASVIGDAA